MAAVGGQVPAWAGRAAPHDGHRIEPRAARPIVDAELIRRLADGAVPALLVAGGAYGLLCGVAWAFSDGVMFQPPPASYADGAGIVRLTTADGVRIAALHLPNPDAEFTVLYSHGNAEDLGHVRPALEVLRRLGLAVVAYDYRGYGLSEGRPTAAGALLDIDAAFAYVTDELGVPPERVILLGRSIGGGPAVDLAARQPVAGLILESTFTTAYRVVTRVPLLPFDRFRNIDLIGKVRCPVLLIHGRNDWVVPFGHAPRLFAAAPEPKRALWIDDAGHNDILLVAPDRYAAAVTELVERLRGDREH